MNRKEDTVFCYYAHNSVWTCELGYGADTMFHRTYFLFIIIIVMLWFNIDQHSAVAYAVQFMCPYICNSL